MKFGLWFDFRNPPAWRRPYAEIYDEALEQIVWAEGAGFSSVVLSEHHVTEDGYLPSIFPALAAIAARTTTIRIGTAVLLAPFYHPIRFAEDAAFVDQLSGGRLDLGLGLGYREREFELLGVPIEERASRTEELVRIARIAWTGEPFTFHGDHWQFDNVVVTPTPLQPAGPSLWLGGTSPAAARRAGRLGCHWMPDASVSAERHTIYRDALAAGGYEAGAFMTTVAATIIVSDDPERAWAEVAPHLLYQHDEYRRWQGKAPIGTVEKLPRDGYIVGTPDGVADAVAALAATNHPDLLFFWARPPGLALEASRRSLELFAEHVLPRFEAVCQ